MTTNQISAIICWILVVGVVASVAWLGKNGSASDIHMDLHRWKDLKRKHLTSKQIAEIETLINQDAEPMKDIRLAEKSLIEVHAGGATTPLKDVMKRYGLKSTMDKKIRDCLAGLQKAIQKNIRQAGGIHPKIVWSKAMRAWVGSAPPTGISDCSGKSRSEVASMLTDRIVDFIAKMTPPGLLTKGTTHERLHKSVLEDLKRHQEEQAIIPPEERFNRMVKMGLINKDGSLCRKPSRQMTIAELELEDTVAWASHVLKGIPMFSPSIRKTIEKNVFPWMRHLSAEQQDRFLAELAYTICMAGLKHFNEVEKVLQPLVKGLEEVICSWKSTSLIHADPKLAKELKRPLEGKTQRIPRP